MPKRKKNIRTDKQRKAMFANMNKTSVKKKRKLPKQLPQVKVRKRKVKPKRAIISLPQATTNKPKIIVPKPHIYLEKNEIILTQKQKNEIDRYLSPNQVKKTLNHITARKIMIFEFGELKGNSIMNMLLEEKIKAGVREKNQSISNKTINKLMVKLKGRKFSRTRLFERDARLKKRLGVKEEIRLSPAFRAKRVELKAKTTGN